MTIFVFLLCALLYVTSDRAPLKTKEQLSLFCILLLALISGLRAQGGTDYNYYKIIYDSTPLMPEVFFLTPLDFQYEIGYVYLISLIKTLHISYYGYIFLNSCFFYFCLWKGLKKYTNEYMLLIIVFLYKLFFYNTFISMRQSITVAGFFLLIPYIENKKWVKYYLGCLILSRFHNGAYLLFLVYPIAYFNLTQRKLVLLNVIFIPTLFLSILGVDIMAPLSSLLSTGARTDVEMDKVSGYFSDVGNGLGIFHTLEYFALMFFSITKFEKINQLPQYNETCFKLFVFLLPLFTLLRSSEIITREKDYFVIFYAVIIWYLTLIENGKDRIAWKTIALLICTFGYFRFVIEFDDGHFLNYTSWLSMRDGVFLVK